MTGKYSQSEIMTHLRSGGYCTPNDECAPVYFTQEYNFVTQSLLYNLDQSRFLYLSRHISLLFMLRKSRGAGGMCRLVLAFTDRCATGVKIL